MELTEAIRHALDGNAVLFTGAGFSLGATNRNGKPFPLAYELSRHLMNDLQETEEVPLQTAAELYTMQRGEVGLLANLNKHLGVESVASHHKEFAQIPWRRVFTTNYDEVFELAASEIGKPANPVVATNQIIPLPENKLTCVHLNGFLPFAKVGNLDTTLILSERSYLTSKILESDWFRLLIDDLRASRAILFLGYSASDLDIARVFVAQTISRKAVFVVGQNPSLSAKTTLGQFGTLAPIGVEGAATICSEIRSNHTPARARLEFASFRRRAIATPRATAPTIDDVFNLLIRGQIDSELLARGFTDTSQKYLVPRRALEEAADHFRNGVSVVAILGRLANGKTTLVEQLCHQLSDQFDILHFDRRVTSIDLEIGRLRSVNAPTIVVFDDYTKNMDVISSILLGANQNLALLLACRTPTHLTHQAELKRAIGGRELFEIRIDTLQDAELEQFDALLAGAGLLGELAIRAPSRRIRHLKEKGNSEIGGLLLWLFESPNIQKRIDDTFKSLTEGSDVQRVVMASLLMAHVGATPDIYDLAELIGAKAMNQALFAESQEVSNFVRLDADRLCAHSALFASAAIRIMWESNEEALLQVVEDIIVRAWDGGRRRGVFNQISRDLMRYSVVKAMAPRRRLNQNVRNYYERIRNLDACANNDLFWLQFAIAEIHAESFFEAEKHIDTSYALASRMKGYRTDHHDNVKAQFLLAREAAEPDGTRAFKSFLEARKIIAAQMASGKHKYYPFRVAQRYGDFWRNVAIRWLEPQRGIFLHACHSVVDQLDHASPDIAQMDDLLICRQEMNLILEVN